MSGRKWTWRSDAPDLDVGDPGGSRGRFSRRRFIAAAGAISGLAAAPGFAQPFVQTLAPRANHLVIAKTKRVLELRRDAEILRRYRIDLGFEPQGHKSRSGDGRTPEGLYRIDRRNPRSEFFLSLGIDYPNAGDIVRARAAGVDPGGDIFIHGEPMRAGKRSRRDWTAGCIAVRNAEIEEIWSMTPTGVPVTILS